MRTRLKVLMVVLLLAPAVLMTSDARSLSARQTSALTGGLPERIRFHITTVEERGGVRNIISETTVEGPPGTDFNVKLQSERFRMSARFLTDLIGPDVLKVRTKLETRRFYGYSEQQLPLYEEDAQSQTLELNFDEAVVLLPFGRGQSSDTLKIEITPAVSDARALLPSGKKRPLEIDIKRPAPGRAISVEATKVPHRFVVEAALLEDGREVARGVSNNLLEDVREELMLTPVLSSSTEARNNLLAVRLSVERFMRSRPLDQAAIGFDIERVEGGSERRRIGSNWAGITDLGSELSYDLSGIYQPAAGRKYELKLRVRLAPGESGE